MRVAILSESEYDERAVRILIEGILGSSTETVPVKPVARDGWSSVRIILPAVIRHLHYNIDAEALVVVVDSDDSPVHQPIHNPPSRACQECRVCQLHAVVANTAGQLRHIQGRPLMKMSIGIALPAIEAWYRYGVDPHVTEAAWIQALQSKIYPYTRVSLKEAMYGVSRPSRVLKTGRGTEEARRLVQDLLCLEQWFPNGFGLLAEGVLNWEA
jgi:hypothetical protein